MDFIKLFQALIVCLLSITIPTATYAADKMKPHNDYAANHVISDSRILPEPYWPEVGFGVDGLKLSAGGGKRDAIRGGRLALQWYWPKIWLEHNHLQMTGYWDMSLAHWITRGDANGDHRSDTIFAVAPVFRMRMHPRYFRTVLPYVEASVGLSLHSTDQIAVRCLGCHLNFQDMLGFGFLLGSGREWDVSFHFLHCSNAGICPPNNGITINWLFSEAYRFN